MDGHGYHVRLSQSPFGWWAECCRSQISPLPKWIGRAIRLAALDTLKRTEGG